MNKFEIKDYNFETQTFTFQVNYPVTSGYLRIKDIDLNCTVSSLYIWDVQPGLFLFIQPTNKQGFDFDQESFGGFEIDLIDKGEVIERKILRFRYPNLIQHRIDNFDDHNHPTFMNYREFFVEDIYKDYNLDNLNLVIDAGASVGLFTRYMLRKGANRVIAIEPDTRSIEALNHNFNSNDKVEIYPSALSFIDGKTKFYQSPNPLNSSLDSNWEDGSKEVEIQLISLETLIKSFDKVDLLKLDVESAEYGIFDNTPDYVFDKVDRILLEFHKEQGRLQNITNKLQNLGFKATDPERVVTNPEFGNIYYYK